MTAEPLSDANRETGHMAQHLAEYPAIVAMLERCQEADNPVAEAHGAMRKFISGVFSPEGVDRQQSMVTMTENLLLNRGHFSPVGSMAEFRSCLDAVDWDAVCATLAPGGTGEEHSPSP